jgi:prepilin-type processing-associated H-X9-DG protein
MLLRRFIFVAGILVSSLAIAQPLADRVPADAMVYIGWQGSRPLAGPYQDSHLRAVVESSNIRKVFEDFIPQALTKIAGDDQDAAETMVIAKALAPLMWRHPVALYFGGIDLENPQMPVVRLALICEAGDEAPELLKQLNIILSKTPPTPFEIKATQHGRFVCLAIGQSAEIDALLDAPADAPAGRSLAKDDDFKKSLTQVQTSPAAVVYVNAQPLLSMIGRQIEAQKDEVITTRWTNIRESLGLNGLRQIIWTCGFDQRDWSQQIWIAAPAPRRGLLAMIDPRPISKETLSLLPKDAFLAGALSFSAERLVTEIQQALATLSPDWLADFEQGMQQANKAVGLNIRQELINNLGDEWAYYADQSIGGEGLMGLIFVNRLKDPAKVAKALDQLATSANQFLAKLTNEITVSFRQTHAGDLEIHYLAIPVVAPSWTIKDGVLYLGLYPQVVAAAAQRPAGQGSILDNPKYISLIERLGQPRAGTMQYLDLPHTAPQGYQSWLMFSRTVLGFGDLFGVPAPAMVVPPLDKLMAELSPAGSVAWSDDEGFHARSISPFPGSETLVIDPISGMMYNQASIMVAVLIPSSNRSRETANRVKCASNLRQLGQAMLLYANENKGKYPPDLGTLLLTQDMTVNVFVCPSSGTEIPKNLKTREERAKWIDEHSDYIYAGAGLGSDAPPQIILIHEKQNNHDHDGMNLLYGDGHVEFQTLPDARQQIESSGKTDPNLPNDGGL